MKQLFASPLFTYRRWKSTCVSGVRKPMLGFPSLWQLTRCGPPGIDVRGTAGRTSKSGEPALGFTPTLVGVERFGRSEFGGIGLQVSIGVPLDQLASRGSECDDHRGHESPGVEIDLPCLSFRTCS